MKKRAASLIVTGCILLSASLVLAVDNQMQSAHAAKSVEELTNAFISGSAANITSWDPNMPVQEPVLSDPTGGSDGDETRGASKKPIVIDGQEYIGLLSIPSLGLKLPVNNDISYPLMRATPCRYYGDEETGSLIIAAHNYNGNFGKIGTLEHGAAVDLTDANGKTSHYSVSEIETLPGNAVDEMIEPGNWDLTLFTCNYSGTERITVRCVKGAVAE